uniref:Uncharacterized protein n=1 Tax=Anguilla anguilla TaxID=7936 RepID=A0A0E9QK37_ANGAN
MRFNIRTQMRHLAPISGTHMHILA